MDKKESDRVQKETYNQVVFLTSEHLDIISSLKIVIEKERISTGTLILFNLVNTGFLVFIFMKSAGILN